MEDILEGKNSLRNVVEKLMRGSEDAAKTMRGENAARRRLKKRISECEKELRDIRRQLRPQQGRRDQNGPSENQK